MRMDYLIVFLGGGIGSACRHSINQLTTRWLGSGLPIGTLGINLLGSLLMGMVFAYISARSHLSPHIKLLLMTGLLGGFTTFSAFSLEVVQLFHRGQITAAIGYASVSVIAGAAAVVLGMWLVRQMMALA